MRESDLAAVAAAKPDLIVFASALGPYKTLESGKTRAPAQAEWTSATLRSMEAVRSVGAPVVVIGNPPEGRRVTDCSLRIFGPDRCVSTIDAVDREERAAEVEAVRQATAQGLPAVYLDPEPWFCTSDGSCPIGVGDVIVRLDSSHLTQSSSESLGGVLRSALVAARVV
ncbi:hypothetical protein O159_07620 [Leifsonia xyli subsp. cynodontis DSM 46306]|jgi:hypothetical protein|uniref:SGNH domain-containing protein n=1 Tax=Leifsonia xyli subsp. cynodontis DSM 46306 TaxID=1389489 RepID=U3P3Q2_LEIXC|nr:SGNH hydrolase domain-containing protein [Leifsonia xyli]AGW40925.1 hypothetical protein O159_07620 [Leifsonia xyli subsp. cynodontis DSM 46306]